MNCHDLSTAFGEFSAIKSPFVIKYIGLEHHGIQFPNEKVENSCVFFGQFLEEIRGNDHKD